MCSDKHIYKKNQIIEFSFIYNIYLVYLYTESVKV